MKAKRGLEDIKTRKNTRIPSAMPKMSKSKYLGLFLLEKEQEKLNREMDILNKQMDLLTKRMKEKQNRLDEIDEEIMEVVKMESVKYGLNGTSEISQNAASKPRVPRNQNGKANSKDAEEQWRMVSIEY
jgi:SMC interacting uncharacterized protein involved in chromosome segregation